MSTTKFEWAKPAETPTEEITISYDVPVDEFWKNKIKAVENENKRLRTIGDTMESRCLTLISEVEWLKKQIEEKDSEIEKLKATVLKLAIGE